MENVVFVVVRRKTGANNAWQLARIFASMEAAEEYQEMVSLGDTWETSIQTHAVWNDGLMTSCTVPECHAPA